MREITYMLSILRTAAAVSYMRNLLFCIAKASPIVINASANAIPHGHCMWL